MLLAQDHNRQCKRRAAKEFMIAVGQEAGMLMAAGTQQDKDFLDVRVAHVNTSHAKDRDLQLLERQLEEEKHLVITAQQRATLSVTKDFKVMRLDTVVQANLSFNKKPVSMAAADIESTVPVIYEPIVCVACLECKGVRYFQCCKGAAHEDCWKEHQKKFTGKRRSDKKTCWYCRCRYTYLIDSNKEIVSFQKAKYLIEHQLADLRLVAQKEKRMLALPVIYEEQKEYEVSDVSAVAHPSQVGSQEAEDTFFDLLSVSEVDNGSLVDAQALQLKRETAERKALQEKVLEYQWKMVQERAKLHGELSILQKLVQEYKNLKQRGGTRVAVRRKEQARIIRDLFKQYLDKMATTEHWLEQIAVSSKKGAPFEKCGPPICDIIIMNRFPLVFDEDTDIHDAALKAFLLSNGVPAAYIRESAGKDDNRASIKLEDSANEFNETLVHNIGAAFQELRKRIKQVATAQKLSTQDTNKELERAHVTQIDFTQDLLGFFIATDIDTALKDLVKAIPLGLERAQGYKQLMTCLQLIKYVQTEEGKKKHIRVKIYNKSVHLLCSGQFKKWLNMKLKNILQPSQAFYQRKIYPSKPTGLVRVEESLYFYSQEEWDKQVVSSFKDANICVDMTINAVNQMRHNLSYTVPLKSMIHGYFQHSIKDYAMVAFEKDLWVISYHYTQRSKTYSGHEVNKTSKSGSRLAFLKRYLYPGQKCVIFADGKFLGVCQKLNGRMQLPIASLNERHIEEYEFGLDDVFAYHLTQEELDAIKITSQNSAVQALLNIPALYDKNEEEKKQQQSNDNSMDDDEEQPEMHPAASLDASVQERRNKLRKGAPLSSYQVNQPKKQKQELGFVQIDSRSNETREKERQQQEQLKKREEKQQRKEEKKHQQKKLVRNDGKRNYWEVRDCDWLKTAARQNEGIVYKCVYCDAGIRANNRSRHNCQ